MTDTLWIILFGALATYATRIGGHMLVNRFDRIPPRVQAGLNAVPAAVLTTLVAPAAFLAGPVEWAALVFAFLVGLRTSLMTMFFASTLLLIVLRQLPFG